MGSLVRPSRAEGRELHFSMGIVTRQLSLAYFCSTRIKVRQLRGKVSHIESSCLLRVGMTDNVPSNDLRSPDHCPQAEERPQLSRGL
ncbi:ATP-dependent DNA helicase [Fusarium oxysporum f. sp. albedinis]|nr:ATP-dependent DNA helicase [Fusarium oxysporum f. sp. albedinis]